MFHKKIFYSIATSGKLWDYGFHYLFIHIATIVVVTKNRSLIDQRFSSSDYIFDKNSGSDYKKNVANRTLAKTYKNKIFKYLSQSKGTKE